MSDLAASLLSTNRVDTAAGAGGKSNLRNRLRGVFEGLRSALAVFRQARGGARGAREAINTCKHTGPDTRYPRHLLRVSGEHALLRKHEELNDVFSGPCRRCRSTAHASNRAASEASTAAQDGGAAGGRRTVPAHIMPWGTLQVRPSAQWGQSRGFSQKPAAQRSPWAAVLVPPGRIGTPKPGSTTGRSSGWAACAPEHTERESSQSQHPKLST